ncbi:phospholipid carrier-dependent glycosyltransferase [Aquabacter sp. L1I39]|uniref:phospholipid carrier-dependent glycosyltransferase n=1 Tax=Aquabacter sp. L1I39 TaxID=2820278 RepID=UPI001ADAB7AA|nr:phospholipid carrier-dependent glycosyltransferase [Aquabacter sp. L1I39]QTL02466.1 phospholipid carrier-dependent glycosyltransferase [Aquabacter sp. L1I39]
MTVVLCGIIFSFYMLIIGIRGPILDILYFRQTQTAISAYWIAQGGPWLAYETPVLGAPWSIPFEFPIFQLIVAAVSKAHVPLDVAGRAVNYSFFLLSLLPLASLARTLNVNRNTYLTTAALFLFSPFYVYWSRTFLIESCALFFGISWMAFVARYLARPHWPMLAGAMLTGSLAVLAKSTTFPAFLMLGGLGTMWVLIQGLRSGAPLRSLAVIAGGTLLAAAIPLALGFAWVAYSDVVKSANEFGRLITSEALSRWNFGTLGQRTSLTLWNDVIFQRAIPDMLGSFYVIAPVIMLFAAGMNRTFGLAILATAAFLFPFLLFTNLHIVHSYYQVANGVFIIIAVGLCVGAIFNAGRPFVGFTLLLLLIGGQISFFLGTYKNAVAADHTHNPLYLVAMKVKDYIPQDKSLIVFGDDWSSAVHYYAERKGIAMPNWVPQPLAKAIAENPDAFLGGYPLGAVVSCRLTPNEHPNLQDFLAGRRLIAEVDICRIYAGDRN